MRSAAPAAAAAAAARPSTRRRKPKPSGTGTPASHRKAPTRAAAAAAPPPATLLGEIADVAADVLDGLGDAVREIAGHLTEHDRFDDVALHHILDLEGAPGETATDEFLLSNTGPTALKGLAFAKTNLIGAAPNPIGPAAVTLTPGGTGTTDRVRPGGSTTVTVAVKIPARAAAGVYRGVVCARFDSDDRDEADEGPVGAWALIELHVVPTDPRPT
jgi:hypothetical protein